MFAKIAAFELRYQLRQPAFWVISILFALLSFGAVAASEFIRISGGGNVHVNSPYMLAGLHGLFNVFYMLATTAIVANVVSRDVQTGFGPMIQTTRISKFDYLYGRFLGAFGAVALSFMSIGFGILMGTLMPWVDPETIGPFRPGDYAWSYLVMGVPGLLLSSALFFALATVTRSMMATYIGVVAVFMTYLVATSVIGRKPEFETAMAWVEPFGSAAYGLVTKYWTSAERNTLNPAFEGVLLFNRLLCIGGSLLILGAAYVLHRPAARGAKLKKQDRLRALAAAEAEAPVRTGPLPAARHGWASALTQLISRTAFEMNLMFRSPAYVVLILLGFSFAVASLWFSGEAFGTPIQLVTRVAISTLIGAFGLISMIIAIYYSGELVWRDRERGMHEIIDATSTPDWTFLVPKTLALALVLVSTLIIAMFAGMLTQTIKGVTDYQLDRYISWYLWPEAVNYAQLAVLAIFVQAMSPNKFVGWAIMVVYIISTLVLVSLGFDHFLYRYASGPAVPLSDMNGTGDFAAFAGWLNAYWSAFALILLVIAFGLWRRGTETRLMPRLKRLPSRLMGPAGLIGVAALAAFVGLGGFIYTNTNVWNEYRSQDADEARLAAYEKALLPFENTPQPAIVDVKLALDLHPHSPSLKTVGSYVIVNDTDKPQTEIHLRWQPDLEVNALSVEGARMTREWKEFDYRIYRFNTPLQPGERRTVRFETTLAQRGFKVRGNTTRLVDNGTFVSNGEFAPMVGMGRDGLLSDRTKRRKRGLPAELRMAKLEETRAQASNYIDADWVNADITVTTDADQTPIAPGYKVSDTTANGRRTARFVTEAPILHFFSVQSARYEILREQHNGVTLEIYHDPAHGRNAPRMIKALETALDYYTTAFGPYQFRQARIVEFPAYASFAQAFANTMPYSEGLGFIADFSDPSKIDYVTYITAHELGHQWWAHQVVSADMQGATTLTETLAQYSALMTMEKLYGPDQIRRFLKYELDNYLRSRGTERLEELPLMRVEANQGYIHYQKGGLVLYLLRDQIGEEAVNRALRRVLAQYAFKGAPYPRSLDLIAALRAEAPADKQALITDLFERITLYDLKAKSATATKRADGRWDVTVTVEARKLYADGQGVETAAPLNEAIDLGLFTGEPGKPGFERSDVVMMERRPVRSGTQTFRFIAATRPTHVGIDPYNRWIDRNSDDNVIAVN